MFDVSQRNSSRLAVQRQLSKVAGKIDLRRLRERTGATLGNFVHVAHGTLKLRRGQSRQPCAQLLHRQQVLWRDALLARDGHECVIIVAGGICVVAGNY